nr:Fe-S oxidoreductase [Gulosibacter bifidus]
MPRLLRRVLLDSPVSRAGCTFATTVALCYGAPLSIGKIHRVDGMWVLRGLPKWAFSRGGTCVGRVYLTSNNVSGAVLRHELVHVRQWERYGMLFPLLYTLAGRDAHTNRFEIEAGLEDGGYVRRMTKPGSKSGATPPAATDGAGQPQQAAPQLSRPRTPLRPPHWG